jgi:hypothetical protein
LLGRYRHASSESITADPMATSLLSWSIEHCSSEMG